MNNKALRLTGIVFGGIVASLSGCECGKPPMTQEETRAIIRQELENDRNARAAGNRGTPTGNTATPVTTGNTGAP